MTRSEPRPLEPLPVPPAYDLWSLIAIYAAACTLMVEASYRLPLALLYEGGRYLRKAG